MPRQSKFLGYYSERTKSLAALVFLLVVPLAIAYRLLHLWGVDLSIPLIYANADDIWQFVLTKVLTETGWVLTNPFLGAPEIANWHHNAAAQTSSAHSILMWLLSIGIDDPIRIQQTYYLLNFPLIAGTSYIACRLLGVSRPPAISVGILFAFTSFRINEMLYAFLANYFAIPLALVPVFWILRGDYVVTRLQTGASWQAYVSALKTRKFILGLSFIVFVTLSDGYYAFFTLLLLGFVLSVRVLKGDWRNMPSLLPASAFIATIILVSGLMMIPLETFKRNHVDEYYPGGKLDSSLVKHPFEAEVYSSSLKLMIAPIREHRIKELAALGTWMVETSDGAKLFKNGRALVPLGSISTILLLISFTALLTPRFKKSIEEIDEAARSLLTVNSLVLFIFLCSIAGGVGTLVALIFPTIRAYDRFPLFLIFLLLLYAGTFITKLLSRASIGQRRLILVLLAVATCLGIFDQVPKVQFVKREEASRAFLAERQFVQKVESQLPTGSMVYQYPYSQYLRKNEYYGWGSFSHVRLYLHSHLLRWSNGGAKNSPADDWNYRISELPLDQLFTEVRAMGFRAVVIDRKVLSDSQYALAKKSLASIETAPAQEDLASRLTFVTLSDPGYSLKFDSEYINAVEMRVTSYEKAKTAQLSRSINAPAFLKLAETSATNAPDVIYASKHPEVFKLGQAFITGSGDRLIKPSAMKGSLTCTLDSAGVIQATLKNDSEFDWTFNRGSYPLGIGIHFLGTDGSMLDFDNGVRWQGALTIEALRNKSLSIPLDAWKLKRGAGPMPPIMEVQLLQDGNAWFEEFKCRIPSTK